MDEAMLADALHDRLGPVAIKGMTRLSGGASRETWAFDAIRSDGSATELVLRRDPLGRPSEPGAMGREALAITAAGVAGLAAPEVLMWTDGPELWESAGLIMRRVDGETIARRILRDDAYTEARGALISQLGEFAAGLHALEVTSDFPAPAPDPIGELRAMLDVLGSVSPTFELALQALEADPPPPRGPVIVHGDLRLGNLIVGPDGLRAVIDWELVHTGSPAEDLGWLCVKAWRFGSGPPAAGLGSREELLAAYRSAGGADISLGELRWWEILGTLRWGLMCVSQAQAHLSGAHRSVELAAIGRRVCEQEWDLLLLLEPEAAAQAALRRPVLSGEPRPDPAPFGRPTASELLDAVREFLTDQVMPATAGQLAFHARVAANALAIVARELELGAAPPMADPASPADLGDRRNPFNPTNPRGLGDLAAGVAARLAVANPRYFGQS
jgi:aminoglycoside phosphotransferase (APT) family kinase protein